MEDFLQFISEIWSFGEFGFRDILPLVLMRQELPETILNRNSRHFGTLDALTWIEHWCKWLCGFSR